MIEIKNQIILLKEQFNQELTPINTIQELETFRLKFLSRNGLVASLVNEFKNLSLEDKKVVGPLMNELKQSTEQEFQAKKENLENQQAALATAKQHAFDVTAYKPTSLKGSLHIYTRVIEQVENVFMGMGYELADGPEVETDYYNFTALNIPANHPARDMHDTFWISYPELLLRTHTSNVQIRTMETKKLPLAIFAPGRVYRNEAIDASHEFNFTQLEGLFVDKNISVAHLLATAKTFLQALFEKKDLQIRARPGYFPFVEPGIEIDAQCPFCTNGCSTCKYTTWIELLGSGLVHPNVLRSCGIDPEIYSGFAFGMGLERLAMIKYGINDIRLFHSNKINFLEQF